MFHSPLKLLRFQKKMDGFYRINFGCSLSIFKYPRLLTLRFIRIAMHRLKFFLLSSWIGCSQVLCKLFGGNLKTPFNSALALICGDSIVLRYHIHIRKHCFDIKTYHSRLKFVFYGLWVCATWDLRNFSLPSFTWFLHQEMGNLSTCKVVCNRHA